MKTKFDISNMTIKQLLNTSLMRLRQPTLERLRDARARALLRHDAHRAESSYSLVGSISWPTIGTQHKPRLWATVLAIAMLFSVATYWQQQATENDLAEVDISILTDDLPMHIYLD